MGRIYPTLPVAFPIDIKIKSGGNTFVHRLNERDRVTCHYCGSNITLTNDTVMRLRHQYDSNVKIRCMICGQMIDSVYYANRSNQISLKAWDSGLIKREII